MPGVRGANGMRKAVIVILTSLAVITFVLNSVNIEGPRWFQRQQGGVVSSISVQTVSGGVEVIEETAHATRSPSTWPTDISLQPLLVRHSFLAHRARRLHRDSRVAFIMATSTRLELWPVFLIFATYPTIAFVRGPVRRWRRRKRGLCIHCGYNLTGLTAPRFPECGEKV